MADGLPEGIVTHSQSFISEIDRVDRVRPEDIARLWKGILPHPPAPSPHTYAHRYLVHAVNRATIADGVGRRLEYFFWRIWSNKEILHRISGRQVAIQFSHILEGGYFRTTPTQSPRLSRHLGCDEPSNLVNIKAPASSQDASPLDDRPQAVTGNTYKENRDPDSLAPRAEPTPSVIPRALGPLPSILKKPTTALTPSSSKPAKVLDPHSGFVRKAGDDDGNRLGPTALRSVEVINVHGGYVAQGQPSILMEPHDLSKVGDGRGLRERMVAREKATTSEKSTGLHEDVKPKTAGKRTVLAKTGSRRRRPTITQRKSSQSSSSTASYVTVTSTSGIKTEPEVRVDRGPLNPASSSHDQDRPLIQRSRQVSPHPLGRRGAAVGDEPTRGGSHAKSGNEAIGLDGLVDRDFRSRFATRSRVDRQPFTPSAGKSAVAMAMATTADHEVIAFTDSAPSRPLNQEGKWSEDFTDEIIRLKPPGSSGPRTVNDGETPALPRSKSQLTLLLEQDRGKSQDGNAGEEAR